jgi:hypothetical protein
MVAVESCGQRVIQRRDLRPHQDGAAARNVEGAAPIVAFPECVPGRSRCGYASNHAAPRSESENERRLHQSVGAQNGPATWHLRRQSCGGQVTNRGSVDPILAMFRSIMLRRWAETNTFLSTTTKLRYVGSILGNVALHYCPSIKRTRRCSGAGVASICARVYYLRLCHGNTFR